MDQAALDNHSASPWNHTLAYPADGTMVNVKHGEVYRYAGGAPLYVSSWDSIGGAQPSTRVDAAALETQGASPWNHSLAFPADGTFVIGGTTGAVYQVAGGVARYVPSWAPYGGVQPYTVVDQSAMDQAGLGVPWNHLRSSSPMVRMDEPARTTVTTTSYAFGWSAPPQSSAITKFDARYRSSAIGHNLGAWLRPASWQNRTDRSVSKSLLRGHRYCVSVRAHNRAGKVSAWSPQVCVSRN